MKRASILIAAIVLTATPVSLQWAQQRPTLTVDKAEAIYGRPATPRSVAGYHRRAYRQTYRAVRRCALYRGGYCVRYY
jgi:hypothetical protein